MKKCMFFSITAVFIVAVMLAGCKDDPGPSTVSVKSVSLSQPELPMEVGGEPFQLLETVLPEKASNKKVTWSVVPEGVVTVVDGLVTPVAVGTATITVTTVSGKKTANCMVTVSSTEAVESILLNQTSYTLVIGGTATPIATVLPENATNKAVTWSSDKPAVAEVDQTGTITAKTVGTAIITVKSTADNTKTATCTVTVVAQSIALTNLALNPAARTLSRDGKFTPVVIKTPTDSTDTLAWTSAEPLVVSVDSTSGEITGLAVTSAPVRVTVTSVEHPAISAYVDVTVTAENKPLTNITLDEATKSLTVGETFTPEPTLTPADTTDTLIWESADSAKVSVNADTGEITGVAVTSTAVNVTVKSEQNPTITATIAVTVTDPAINNPVLITSVSIPGINLALTLTGSTTLTPEILPANASTKTLAWESTNTNVATVANGVVNAVAAGETTIKAATTDGSNIEASVKVTVYDSSKFEYFWTAVGQEAFDMSTSVKDVNGKPWVAYNGTPSVNSGGISLSASNYFLIGSNVAKTTLTLATTTVEAFNLLDGKFDFSSRTKKVYVDYHSLVPGGTAGTADGGFFEIYVNNNNTNPERSPLNGTSSRIFGKRAGSAEDVAQYPDVTILPEGTIEVTIDPAVFTENAETLEKAFLNFRCQSAATKMVITSIRIEDVPEGTLGKIEIKTDADFSALAGELTLSKTEIDAPKTSTISLAGYATADWYLDGAAKVTGATFELNAAELDVGEHSLTITITVNGKPYSKMLTIQVNK